MTRLATATITAVDRKAGTITLQALNDQRSAFLEDQSKQVEAMFRQIAEAVVRSMWGHADDYKFMAGDFDPVVFGVTRTADVPARLAGCRIGPAPAGTLSAPALVALTTLCAMEWLRHRKQAVAAAEQSGDYSSLIEEFVAWLRGLFAEWRKALGHG